MNDRLTPAAALDADDGALPPASRTVAALRRRAGHALSNEAELPEETAIAFEFNGISGAVMMATPADFDDFALGFALTEGIVDERGEIFGIEARAGERGITLEIELAQAAFNRMKARRRVLAGRTGCGLCGIDSLEQAIRPLPASFGRGKTIAAAAIARANAALLDQQPLSRRTGATHAAAWCRVDGAVTTVREDVGRHNALDKLIGALARAGADTEDGFVLVTSRASTEMVQKTAVAGATTLVAVSAATASAVRIAADIGMTLVGFARGEDFTIYAHPARIVQ